jgi:ankyrin repeat protein
VPDLRSSAIDYAWMAVFEKHVAPMTVEYLRGTFLLGQNEDLDKYELSELHKIVLGLCQEDLDSILSEIPHAMINKPDAFGKTALLWAARRGDLETLKGLLQHGANPNISDQMRRSPLHMAARSRSLPVIQALIKYGADPIAKNFLNETPAHYACYENNDISLIEPFIDAGMDVNIPSKYGRTLLDIAVQWDFPDTADYLITHGAKLEGISLGEYTMKPLGRAIFYNSHKALAILLQKGADTTYVDDNGLTIFHLIAEHGDLETINIFKNLPTQQYPDPMSDNVGISAKALAMARDDECFEQAFTEFLKSMEVTQTASSQRGSEQTDRAGSDDNVEESVRTT